MDESGKPNARTPEILKRAWILFLEYDQNAILHQRTFHRRQGLVLILGLLAVLLAIVQTQFIGTDPPIELNDVDEVKIAVAESKASFEDVAITPQSVDSLVSLSEALLSQENISDSLQAQALLIRARADTIQSILDREVAIIKSRWFLGLQFFIVLVPIGISIAIGMNTKLKPGPKWIMLRSAAESVKREIYLYRGRAGIYSPTSKLKKSPEIRLAEQLKSISDRLMKSVANEAGLEGYKYENVLPESGNMAELKLPKDNPREVKHIESSLTNITLEKNIYKEISAEEYLDFRLNHQLHYFRKKTKELGVRLKVLHYGIYIAGGLGTLLAAFGFEIWVALTTSVATAFVTYLEYRQTENTLMSYNQVANDLSNIKNWWYALDSSEREKPENEELLIEQTEQALANELSGWVRNMTDALAELQEKQSKRDASALDPKRLVEDVRRFKENADQAQENASAMLSNLQNLIDTPEKQPSHTTASTSSPSQEEEPADVDETVEEPTEADDTETMDSIEEETEEKKEKPAEDTSEEDTLEEGPAEDDEEDESTDDDRTGTG